MVWDNQKWGASGGGKDYTIIKQEAKINPAFLKTFGKAFVTEQNND